MHPACFRPKSASTSVNSAAPRRKSIVCDANISRSNFHICKISTSQHPLRPIDCAHRQRYKHLRNFPAQIVGDAPGTWNLHQRIAWSKGPPIRDSRLRQRQNLLGKTYLRSPMNWVNQWHLLPFSEFLKRREKAIAAQAEQYWVMRGRPEGSPEVDWFKAETEIDQQFLGEIDLGLPS